MNRLFKLAPIVFAASVAAGSMGSACASGKPSALTAPNLKPMPSCKEAKFGGPEDMVREMYAAFPFGAKPVDQEPERVLLKYFDLNLTHLFLRNQQCLHNHVGICEIDVGILYNAQGGEVTDPKVCEMSNKHVVDVQFRNNGEPQVVSFYMVNTNTGWRIADIIPHMETGEFSWAKALTSHQEELQASWKNAQAYKLPVVPPKGAKPLPQCEMAKGSGPEDTVRRLYHQYPWKDDRIIIDEPRKVLLTYFDENLTSVIVKHHEKMGDGYVDMPNIIVNHDMEESLNVISGFHICSMDAVSKTVRVQFYNDGDRKVVMYKLSDTAAGWRISDIFLVDIDNHAVAEGEYYWSLLEGLAVE